MLHKYCKSRVEDVDEKGRVVVAANAFGNEDADGDISMEGSFQKTLKENFSRVKWFLNHDKSILLGVPIEGVEAYPYLRMVGQLNMKKQISRDTYEDYKLYAEYNKTLEHSIGVNPMKRDAKEKQRVLEWKLWEYSTLTSWGANENTPMLGIKSYEDIPGCLDWLELKMQKGNYTDAKFKQIEQQLSILRSLLIEPDATTHIEQPSEIQEQLSNILIHLNNGRN